MKCPKRKRSAADFHHHFRPEASQKHLQNRKFSFGRKSTILGSESTTSHDMITSKSLKFTHRFLFVRRVQVLEFVVCVSAQVAFTCKSNEWINLQKEHVCSSEHKFSLLPFLHKHTNSYPACARIHSRAHSRALAHTHTHSDQIRVWVLTDWANFHSVEFTSEVVLAENVCRSSRMQTNRAQISGARFSCRVFGTNVWFSGHLLCFWFETVRGSSTNFPFPSSCKLDCQTHHTNWCGQIHHTN